MDWKIDAGDFVTGADFEDFVKATVLFEIWRPDREIERIRITLKRVHPRRPLHRCRVEVELTGGTYVGGTIGQDPRDTVQRAAIVVAGILPDRQFASWTDLLAAECASRTPAEIPRTGS